MDRLLPLLLLPPLALLFNLDTDFPLILHDLYDHPNSHFGLSLTLLSKGWLMIGAPKANGSGLNYTDVKEPGVVWRCRVGPGVKECRVVQMDPTGNLDVTRDSVAPEMVHRDRKDQGMLGASMACAAGSDRFVACASRWVNQKYPGHHLMNGICYWVNRDHLLSNHTNATWPWINYGGSGLAYRLSPLINRGRQAYTVPTVPVQDPPDRRFDWAFGQTGFSIHMSTHNEIILGAPGILGWTGSVIRMKDQGRMPYGNVIVARAQHQFANNILEYFDYFGYSVTGGKFFESSDERLQYASGAPRAASLCGKVLVFSFQEGEGREGLDLLVEPIQGSNSHFGSYFGASLAGVDINGDGFDELLVGAPLFKSSHLRSTPTPTNTPPPSHGSGDEGCVFVYISTGLSFRSVTQEICGDSRPGARFGSAITALGDLNMDGYQDVAIGAPYENEGRGAVYVYHGSRTGLGLAQKVEALGIDTGLRGFGYSIASGMDIDDNQYPDLAIGSAFSNHVVVLRTIPVVELAGNLTASVSKLKTNLGKFEITSCLSFSGLNAPDSLQIILKLILDTEVRKGRIAEFLPAAGAQEAGNVILKTRLVQRTGTCHTFPATTMGDLDLVTIPLALRQEFGLLPQPKESIHSKPLSYQILKGADGQPMVEQVGRKDAVYEDLSSKWPLSMWSAWGVSRHWIPLAAICEEDGNPSCLATLSIHPCLRTPDGDLFKEGSEEEFLIGSYRSISLEIQLRNERETANLPLSISISWKGPPTVRSTRSDCSRLNAELGGDSLVYVCNIGKPLTKNKEEMVELELDMGGVFGARESLHFEIRANTSSALTQEPISIFTPPLKTKSEVLVFGQLSEAPYYENLTAETINFTHTFEVGMNGVSPIAVVHMDFFIPRDVEINGEVLELLRIREPVATYDGDKLRCIGLNGHFYVDPTASSILEDDDFDLDGFSEGHVQRNHRLKRRSVAPRSPSLMRRKATHLALNCSSPGMFCLRVRCEATRFRPTSRAVVEFRLRLVTRTAGLLFDGAEDRELLVIESEGQVRSLSVDGVHFGGVGKGTSRTLVKVQPPQEMGAWVLILSFVGGILLLSILSLLLVKCGFFRRTQKEMLYALRTEQGICDRFGFPAENDYEEYPLDPLPNYDYEEIYEGSESEPSTIPL